MIAVSLLSLPLAAVQRFMASDGPGTATGARMERRLALAVALIALAGGASIALISAA